MKTTKKLSAMLLATLMTLTLFAALPPATASAVDVVYEGRNTNPIFINIDTPEKLAEALAAGAEANRPVINISGSFEYTETIAPSRYLDINLNGHTLTVNAEGAGLQYSSRFLQLIVRGPGTLNVTGTKYGIYVSGPAEVITTGGAVINAAGVGDGSYGVYVRDGGTVGTISSATATGKNSYAVFAVDSRRVSIAGGDWQVVCSTVYIDGSAAASGSGSVGASAQYGGRIYVSGSVSGDKSDIRVGSTELSMSSPTKTNTGLPDGSNYPAPDGYLWDEYSAEYSQGTSYVFKRQGSIPGVAPTPNPHENRHPAPVTALVTRLYKNVLEREPDLTGLQTWVDRLTSRQWGGGQVAETFFFDPKYNEFLNRGLNNEQFLKIMYNTFMDREPDEKGWEAWLDRMANQGYTWKDVFNGFVVSREWGERCDAAGIRR